MADVKKERAPYVPHNEDESRRQAASLLVAELRRCRKLRGAIGRDFGPARKLFTLLQRHHAGRMPDELEALRTKLRTECDALGEAGTQSPTLAACLDSVIETLQTAFGVHDEPKANKGDVSNVQGSDKRIDAAKPV